MLGPWLQALTSHLLHTLCSSPAVFFVWRLRVAVLQMPHCGHCLLSSQLRSSFQSHVCSPPPQEGRQQASGPHPNPPSHRNRSCEQPCGGKHERQVKEGTLTSVKEVIVLMEVGRRAWLLGPSIHNCHPSAQRGNLTSEAFR